MRLFISIFYMDSILGKQAYFIYEIDVPKYISLRLMGEIDGDLAEVINNYEDFSFIKERFYSSTVVGRYTDKILENCRRKIEELRKEGHKVLVVKIPAIRCNRTTYSSRIAYFIAENVFGLKQIWEDRP